MSTNYPTGLDSFPSQSTLAGHQLNTDPHSQLHANLGDAIRALQTLLGITGAFNFLGSSNNLADLVSVVAARTNLGLGSAATQNTSAFDAAGAAAAAQAASQPLDSDLTAIAALTTTAFGRGGLTQVDGPGFRTYIGAGVGDALTTNPLSQFAATTSSQLAGVISDETGTGKLVFATSPMLTTPTLGAATVTSVNGNTITTGTGTLTLSTFTLTAAGTASVSGTNTGDQTIPAAANPSGLIGMSAVNGVATTFDRSDSTHAIDPAIAPTWTGLHTFATTARSSGVGPYFRIVTPADTAQTLSTESIGIAFGGTNANPPTTVTRQWATGTLALQRENYFVGPTISFVGASTCTELDTVYVKAGVAGTNATITRNNAIVSEGQLTVRQVGGTAGSNECQIFHDGNDVFISNVLNAPSKSIKFSTAVGLFSFYSGTSGAFTTQLVLFNGSSLQTNNGSLDICNGSPGSNVPYLSLYPVASNVPVFACGATTGGGGGSHPTWLQNSAGRARASAGDNTNATASMANIDGTNLKATLIAGRKYFGWLVVQAKNSVGAEGLQFDFNGGTATATLFQAGFDSTPVGATLGTPNVTALATALTVTVAATTDTTYVIPLYITCNAAGTFIPRFAEVSHTTGTATVRATTCMLLEDMPT